MGFYNCCELLPYHDAQSVFVILDELSLPYGEARQRTLTTANCALLLDLKIHS